MRVSLEMLYVSEILNHDILLIRIWKTFWLINYRVHAA